MDAPNVANFVAELEERYLGTTVARDSERTLVRLPRVWFPEGCKPECGEALLVLHPAQPPPELYLRVIPVLPNGAHVASNPTLVAGESWFTYSFNLNWDENKNTATQFVEGKLQRFARNG